jgi:hypothetical protein
VNKEEEKRRSFQQRKRKKEPIFLEPARGGRPVDFKLFPIFFDLGFINLPFT